MKLNDKTSSWGASTVAMSSSIHCAVPVSEFVKLFNDEVSAIAPPCGQAILVTDGFTADTGTARERPTGTGISYSAAVRDGGGVDEHVNTSIIGRDNEQGMDLMSGKGSCIGCDPEVDDSDDALLLAEEALVVESSGDTPSQTGSDEDPPLVGGTLVLKSSTANHTEIDPPPPPLVTEVGEELGGMRYRDGNSEKDGEGGHNLASIDHHSCDTVCCCSNNDPNDILNERPEEIMETPLNNLPLHCRSGGPTPAIGVLDTPSPLSTPACIGSVVAIPPSQEDVIVINEPAAKRRACIPGADFVPATPLSLIQHDGSMAKIRSSPLLPLYYSSQQSTTFVTDSEVEPSPSLSSTQRKKHMPSFDHSTVAIPSTIDTSSILLPRKVEVEEDNPSTVSSGDNNKVHKSTPTAGDDFSEKQSTTIQNSCTSSTDVDAVLYDHNNGCGYAEENNTPKTRRYTGSFQPSCSDTNSSAIFMYNVPGGLSQTPPKMNQDGISVLRKLSSSESMTATKYRNDNDGVLQSASNPTTLTNANGATTTPISTSNASTWRTKASVGGDGYTGTSSTFTCPTTAASSASCVYEVTPRSSKTMRPSLASRGLFTAASGRKLNVSEDALKKAQKMFATDSSVLPPPSSSSRNKVTCNADTPMHPSSSLPSTSREKYQEGKIGAAGPQRNHAISSKKMFSRRDSSSYVDLRSGGFGEEGGLRCVANGGMNRRGGRQQQQRTGFSTGGGKVLFVSDEALARVESNGMGTAVKQVPSSQSRGGGTVGNSKPVMGEYSATRTASSLSHARKLQSSAAVVEDSHSTVHSFSSSSSSYTLTQPPPMLSVRLNSLGPPKIRTVTSAVSQGVPRVVAVLSADTALKLRFSASTGAPCCYNSDSLSYDQVFPPILSSCTAHDGQLSTVDTLYNRLLDLGADRKLLTRAWVRNHARWVIWKFACLERSWPKLFSGRLLNLDKTSQQLRKRYFLELERIKKPKGWPLVRSIMHGDASFSMPMTLCVTRMLSPGTLPITKKQQCEDQGSSNTDEGAVVELTDGWHAIRAKLDPTLSHYSRQRRIEVGMKLCVLPTAFEGPLADPLEVDQEALSQNNVVDLPREGPRLKLCCNSTRRARWSAPLGPLKGVPGLPPLCVPLCSVNPLGGLVAAVKVIISRRYAPQYVDYASGTAAAAASAVRVLSEEEMHGIQGARQDAATLRLEGKEEEIMRKMLSSPTNSALPGGQREILRRLKEDIVSQERSSFLRPRPFISVSLACPCKACLGGKRLQRSTELRVWEPSIDVAEQLEPGRLAVLQRVDVPLHVKASNGISLHLGTTRSTTIEFPETELIQSFIPSPQVTCAYLGGVAAQFLFWGVDDEDTPNVKPPGGDIDFVGVLMDAYVLEDTSGLSLGDFATREHRIFFIDASNQVICIKRHVARDVFTHCRVLSGCRGSCWSACDARVMSYDEANSILQASWSNHTVVTCTSRAPLSQAQKQMQHLLRELKQWCNTDSGRGALREAAERVELSLKGTGFVLTSSFS